MSIPSSSSVALERELLTAARAGDENAYRGLVEPRRAELHAHCYRMLGSVQDAEDAVQETLLRAWRGLPRFEGRSSLRAWLYTIATNACLNGIARRPKRVLPPATCPPPSPARCRVGRSPNRCGSSRTPDEQIGIESGYAAPEARYEQRESLELAFVAALQHLAPRQRAVLILREVLGFSAAEAASSLGTTVASVNSALQRARKTLDGLLPEQSQQTTLRALGDERLRRLAERYADAIERSDVETLLSMLTEDAAWSMPPLATWYRGHESIARFLVEYPLTLRWRHLPTHANGQVAVGCYIWDEERGVFGADVIDVLDAPRRADRRGHRFHVDGNLPPVRPARRASAGLAPGCRAMSFDRLAGLSGRRKLRVVAHDQEDRHGSARLHHSLDRTGGAPDPASGADALVQRDELARDRVDVVQPLRVCARGRADAVAKRARPRRAGVAARGGSRRSRTRPAPRRRRPPPSVAPPRRAGT